LKHLHGDIISFSIWIGKISSINSCCQYRPRSVAAKVGVSPGWLADLQGKYFGQLEQLHKVIEHNTLTEKQFEK